MRTALTGLQAARHTQANPHGQVRGKNLTYKMALNPGSLLPPARDPPFPTSCTNKTYCLSCFLAKFSHLILTEGTSTAGLTLMSVLNSATAQAFSPSKEKWPRGCYGFSSSLVWMRELDHKKGWSVKNWCFQTVVLEKTLEYPLDCKEIKPVNPKGISSEYSLERLMLTLKLQYFGHLIWRADLLEKTLMLRKTEGRKRGWQRMR